MRGEGTLLCGPFVLGWWGWAPGFHVGHVWGVSVFPRPSLLRPWGLSSTQHTVVRPELGTGNLPTLAVTGRFCYETLGVFFLTKRLLPTDAVLDMVATFYSDYNISKKYKHGSSRWVRHSGYQ